jgi:hypothetical protein
MDYQVKEICRRYDFYESSWNPGGSLNNDYVDNGDGTLADETTGLMWQKSGSNISMSRRKANYYIKNSILTDLADTRTGDYLLLKKSPH